VRKIAAEEQSNKMACDMEVSTNQRCVTEFLHVEEIALLDIRQFLLKDYGDQMVNVSTVCQWVVCFSSGDNDVRDRPHSRWPCTAVSKQNKGNLILLMQISGL
jgi:hypothetical protein